MMGEIQMKYEKDDLKLEKGIQKEWIITNGMGGYSSSTILGINTRKYHGLLVAPLNPPAKRYLILSKVDECFESEGVQYPLYANMGKNYITQGYQYLTSFVKEYVPIFTYEVAGATIKKFICMDYGKNTVCVLYHIKNNDKRTKFTVAPILNFRDFHTVTYNATFDLKQEVQEKKVKIVINEQQQFPVYLNISEGKYVEHFHDTFRNMYYIEEEKRGFFPEENLSVPGSFEIEIPQESHKEISFVCSLEENIEEINVKKVINKEIIRINELMYESGMIEEKQDIEKLPKNIKVNLLGELTSTDIYKLYKENSYHIFVNVSESEGIPVSIMEASSFGIPVIATNVGGVGEIVENGYNGLLLNKDFLNRDLSVCLKSIACMVDNDYQTLRKHAREMWEERYNSSVNYSKFVRILNELF